VPIIAATCISFLEDRTGVTAAADILAPAPSRGIATITFNRPGKRNAISLAMWKELTGLITDLGARDDVRVIVLTGAGGHFSAGADISEFSRVRSGAESGRVYEAINAAATLALRDCPKTTIAAVSGYGMGGGCALALACDFRVGDASTRMGIPAARLGVVYGELDTALLYRQLGLANAKRVLYTGQAFPAEDCAGMGLLDIIGSQSALAAAMALAEQVAANAPLSLTGAKLILESLANGTTAARRAEIEAIIDRSMNSRDVREGASAFLAKRKPAFTGE
jgi:enoyl-CoA hydratase/carnithine racemase